MKFTFCTIIIIYAWRLFYYHEEKASADSAPHVAIQECTGISPVWRSFKGMAADIVINEVLFNPPPEGVDYIELYNLSDQAIDLKDLFLSNRSSTGSLGTLKALSRQSRLFPPGAYLVICEEPDLVRRLYQVKDTTVFLRHPSMPSYPDAAGTVVLLNQQQVVLDEVHYSEKWHFPLINEPEGVALERIDPYQPAQDPGNWHSAATSAGYGTPGYANSQRRRGETIDKTFVLQPRIFSPDNDGFDDYIIIRYKFPAPGYVCNITLFSIAGTPVRYLARNAACGTEGYFKWDGTDEKNHLASAGNYIMLAEAFNLQGKTSRHKAVVTLAKRLN